jgi:putative transposase
MPRQARVDVPGQYYHVMSRGIERGEIFSQDEDYRDFLGRFEEWLGRCGGKCMAWCLMPNHFHFLLLRGERPLSELMHHVMTGYAVNYNLRRQRCGHLFQNRYKAIICGLEEYFLEAAPYIHLNPLRAGLVDTLQALGNYPWSGHRALVTGASDGILCAQGLLAHYGGGPEAFSRYMAAMKERAAEMMSGNLQGRRNIAPRGELKDIVAEILKKSERIAELPRKDRPAILAEASRLSGVACEEILRPNRMRAAARARAIYCYLCREQGGVSGTELMAELKINQSAISKLVAKGRVLVGAIN